MMEDLKTLIKLKDELAICKSELSKLSAEKEELSETVSILYAHVSDNKPKLMTTIIKRKNELSAEVQLQKETIQQLHNILSNNAERIKYLENSTSEVLQLKLQEQLSSKAQLIEKIEELKTTIKEQCELINSQKRTCSVLEKKIKEIQFSRKSLINDSIKLREEIAMLETKISNQNEKLQICLDSQEKLKAIRLKSFLEKHEEIVSLANTLKKENLTLKKLLDKKEFDCEVNKKIVSDLYNELENKAAIISELRIKHKDMEEDDIVLKARVSSLKSLESNVRRLENANESLSIRLENCQKELRKYVNPIKLTTINKEDSFVNGENKDFSSTNNDGSKDIGYFARDNSTYGSYPSFDNYGDDYLDDSKEGYE